MRRVEVEAICLKNGEKVDPYVGCPDDHPGLDIFRQAWKLAMIKAVLLDLDNTLLHNPDQQWMQTFRQGWDRHFASRCGIAQASDALRSAMGRLNSSDVART